MLDVILNYKFLQNALLCAVLSSIACGIIGSIIVEKKIAMMSGGIAHTAFGGVGLGYYTNIEPMIGALIFSIASALGIKTIQKNTRSNADVLVGMFWALGMSLGILFISFTPGYPPDMTSYLFGDILITSTNDLLFIGILDIVIILVIRAFYHQWQAYIFDSEFAAILRIPVELYDYILYTLIAITVVILVRVVGIILIVGLLTIPPSLAKQYTRNFTNMILLSILFGMIFCLSGLALSFEYNIPSGATIILISVLFYILILSRKEIRSQKLL